MQPAPVRQMRPQAVRDVPAGSEGIVRTIAAPRTATGPSAIHKSEPRRFNEARDVADRFKEGTAVHHEPPEHGGSPSRAGSWTSRRDSCTGWTGRSRLVANRVYLLTPANVEVSAEEREKIAGGMFYNQF